MKLTIKKKIGVSQYDFIFEGSDLFECLMESQKISFYDLTNCGICESNLLRIYAYETKEDKFKYIKVICASCKGSLTLGQSKKDNAYYYRKNEHTKKLDWQPAIKKDDNE